MIFAVQSVMYFVRTLSDCTPSLSSKFLLFKPSSLWLLNRFYAKATEKRNAKLHSKLTRAFDGQINRVTVNQCIAVNIVLVHRPDVCALCCAL